MYKWRIKNKQLKEANAVSVAKENKDANELANLVQEFSGCQVVVVGNSMKSDILPAVQLGIPAIRVLRTSWRYEDIDDGTTRVATARSLSEVEAILTRGGPNEFN